MGCLSTHEGEERTVHLRRTAALRRPAPDLLSDPLPPAIPNAGDAARYCRMMLACTVQRRSRRRTPPRRLSGDTLGEFGSVVTASDVVFLGGLSLPIGGTTRSRWRNRRLLCFRQPCPRLCRTYAQLETEGPRDFVADGEDLTAPCSVALDQSPELATMTAAASRFIAAPGHQLECIASRPDHHSQVDTAQ